MFGLTAIPSFLLFMGMAIVPESPRWLARNDKLAGAQAILAPIYARNTVADIASSLASQEAQHVRFSYSFEPRMRKVLVLSAILAVFQQ